MSPPTIAMTPVRKPAKVRVLPAVRVDVAVDHPAKYLDKRDSEREERHQGRDENHVGHGYASPALRTIPA